MSCVMINKRKTEREMNPQSIPPTSLRLCIDRFDEDDMSGRILGVALESEIPFSSVRSFVASVDKAYDTIGQPQSGQISRTFGKQAVKPMPYVAVPKRYHASGEIKSAAGSLKTFDLIMQTRHHAEWQGVLKDAEGNLLGTFKSVLECIQLMTDH